MSKPIVTLITARRLSPEQLSQVQVVLKKKLGSFTLNQVTDSGLMGGLKIKLGSQEFDASLKGKLEKLEPQLPELRVITAIPISPEQRQKIRAAVEARLGTISLVEEIDPNIIGGIKLITGSIQYDGSIQNKLEKLKKQMLASI